MPEPAFLAIRCPSCGAASDRVPASLAGRTVRCPRCASRFAVPIAAPEPEPAPTRPDTDEAAPTVAEAGAVAPTVAEAGALAPTRAEGAAAPTGAPAAGWQPGELVLGLYEVKGTLGQGGMGRVYRVRHRGWGLDLAVKAPLPSVLEAAGGADLFEREAETWVNLGLHPHVVTCHYVRRTDGLPLVFAEYMDGGSLHDAIRARRLDSAEALLDVAIQFAWGLHHAHEQGLVHRDVKPANVMLAADGVAKVTDFGLARARSARVLAPAGAAAGHTLTVEGGGGGTRLRAPEQGRRRDLNRRADL
jgi:serine/threonine protein kinase